ncbi:ABC transporter permease [Metabacillus sp. RGM 3146]|uniref:ABC transporter permease n=1 Tax=Metabacillus sp. RGM 3146 TaxID=3401092 RepID=UPI003B99761C
MMKLIQNEMIKIISKKSSWIYFIILALMLLVGVPLFKFIMGTILQHNAPSNWEYMETVVPFISSFVTLFTVIVGSGNVAAEFSDGTIKQLLIRPHQRWKILLSKYIAITLYSAALLLFLLLFSYLTGLLFFGNGSFNAASSVLFDAPETGSKMAIGQFFFYRFVLYIPGLLIVTSISFMLSSLFRSQALAVGLGIFVLFFSSTTGQIITFLMNKYSWMKYLIFPHLDMTKYAVMPDMMKGITIPFSLSILFLYYAVFMALTFIFFQRRDISI